MSYAEQIDQVLASNVTLATTGDKGAYATSTGCVIRRLAVSFHTEPTATGVIAFDKIDATGARGAADVGTLNVAAGHVVGQVLYKNVNVQLLPGEAVVAEVTDALDGVTVGSIMILVDPDWEAPAAVSRMIASS